MCGFGGVINHNTALQAAQIGQIASKVGFRGPDSCGIRILNGQLLPDTSGHTAFFFNRLAIIDLDSRSDQPFEDDDHLLIFNGEIYNYTTLRASLQDLGVTFRTSSDTEVLFHALRQWGKKALERLNGMFAFFWLNKREQTFLVCRDRLGIKPLYYYIKGNSFYFASELHSIIRLSGIRPSISARAVETYLWMQFVPTPLTIFEHIYKLQPGGYIESSLRGINENLQPQIYWDAYAAAAEAQATTPDRLEDVLKDSIERQMQADVPLGLFLSSGVDSSLLAAVVNKYFSRNQEVNFFTVSFSEQTLTDESRDADRFIEGFHNPHLRTHLLSVDAKSFGQRLNNLYDYYDEPFGDYASLLNWVISEKAREHVTVALSGDGADELFWGYDRYNKWRELDRINSFPLLSKTIAGAASALPATSQRQRIQRIFQPDAVQRHFDLFLMPSFRHLLQQNPTRQPLWAMQNIDAIAARKDLPAILDLKTYLADAMLYKVDRSSMATSLEVRVPYLDNTVIDYALGLPLQNKSDNKFQNKAVLKHLLTRLAPHYDTARPKKGFSFPLKSWLTDHWKEQVLDSVTANTLSSLGLDPKPFVDIVSRFYRENTPNQVEVWYLFSLALWKQQFDRMTSQY